MLVQDLKSMDYCHVKAFKFLILDKIFTKINIYKQYDNTVIHIIDAQKYRHFYIYIKLYNILYLYGHPIELTIHSAKIIICSTKIVFI